jgi:hypothetical protein
VAAIGGAHAPDLAILYRAAPVGGSVARTWPVGSYVVELAAASDPADTGVEAAARWFMGLVVRLPG